MYNSLVGTNQPTDAELQASWLPTLEILTNLVRIWNKPVIVTEIGYMSQDGNLQHPWNWLYEDGVVDQGEQADGYLAALEVLFPQPWLYGLYFWDYGTDPFEGGPCDQHYTPHDKLAEDVLREWYGGAPRPTPVPAPLQPAQTMDVYTDSLVSGWTDLPAEFPVNWRSTLPVFQGNYALSATLPDQGFLSLKHSAFDMTPYYGLEFYIMKTALTENLKISIIDENSLEHRQLPLCRFVTNPLEPYTWWHVFISLDDLDVSGKRIQEITFTNKTHHNTPVWLDELRFISLGN